MQRLRSRRLLLPDPGGAGLRLVSGEIRIDGAFIREVLVDGAGETGETGERRDDEETGELIDVGDQLVTPAFVNAHTHLSLTCLRGVADARTAVGNVVEDLYYPVERNLRPGDVKAFTRLAAYESLLAGVGCVFDHYYYGREVAEACAEVGLGAVVFPTLQDVAGPGIDQWEAQLEATVALHHDEELRARGVLAGLGPHATDTVSDALWSKVAELAEREGLLWHAHVGQSFEELERSLTHHGRTPIARLERLDVLEAGPGGLLVHGLYLDDADVGRLDPARHAIGYCPFAQMQFAFPLPLESWRARGIPLVVGTDCAAGNDTWNVQAELRLLAGGGAFGTTHSPEHAAFRESGALDDARAVQARRRASFEERARWAEPAPVLSAVWKTPGELLPGLGLGEIRPGGRANLLVWDVEHPSFWPGHSLLRSLVVGDVTHAIGGLMVSGRWIGERGDFARSLRESDGYRAAREEATDALAGLMSRAGLASP